MSWRCSYFAACMFILYNLLGQLGSVALVLFRKHVDFACANLFFTVFLQTIAYSILWDIQFLFRNFALCGALLLEFHLWARTRPSLTFSFSEGS